MPALDKLPELMKEVAALQAAEAIVVVVIKASTAIKSTAGSSGLFYHRER